MNRAEDSPQSGERLFLEHLGLIRRVADITAARYGLSADEAEDFKGWVTLKLMEDNYALIRRFRGESAIKTYLAVVVSQQFHEHRRSTLQARWRPSAAARRLGPLAMRLERLVYHDGYTLAEAAEVLRTSEPDLPELPQLARLLAQLPVRVLHRPVQTSIDAAEREATPDQADTALGEEDAKRRRARVLATVERALGALPPEDGVIVRLHLANGLSLGDVARTLGLEQKPLYRRVEQLRATLRQQLKNEGITESMVGDALAGYTDP